MLGDIDMPKYRLEVVVEHFKEVIVEADDYDHALEIGSEVSEFMDTDHTTFNESNWKAVKVSDEEEVSYEPVQDYLK